MNGDDDQCRIVEVDGTTMRFRGNGKPLTPKDIEALTELLAIVKALPLDPGMEARREASRKRVQERNARLREQITHTASTLDGLPPEVRTQLSYRTRNGDTA